MGKTSHLPLSSHLNNGEVRSQEHSHFDVHQFHNNAIAIAIAHNRYALISSQAKEAKDEAKHAAKEAKWTKALPSRRVSAISIVQPSEPAVDC